MPYTSEWIQLSSEPFELVHYHGDRDAVPRTLWKTGQRVTLLDFLTEDIKKEDRSQFLISTGTIAENLNAPPSGGCVVSVEVLLPMSLL